MPQERSRRRLAAILAADVIGYSGLMGLDERGTHLAVKRLRTDRLEPLLRRFDGRLIKTTGDGFLFEFDSVFDAFDFASVVQGQGGGEADLRLRMGLNIGDIILDDGDVFGDGVNIAARLEPKSPPGGILISHRAWEDLRRLPLTFSDAGLLDLKNIREPLRAWSLDGDQLRAYSQTLEAPDLPVTPTRTDDADVPADRPVAAGKGSTKRRRSLVLGSLALLLLGIGGLWFALRPASAVQHAMEVRLADFQLLSKELPDTLGTAIRDEIVAAFNKDGVVGVSTAAGPPPGQAPAYLLAGTVQRTDRNIRVITHLTNERSTETLWSRSFDYGADQVANIPRHIAVDAGNVVRCGLFGASTYRKPLPDNVLSDYLQFCQGHWNPDMAEGRNALIPAQRVVAAVPDFSWGWAAVAGAYWKVAGTAGDERLAAKARASGREAADRAVAIDPRNSETLYIKAMLLDPTDWFAREALFKRAVAARRLDCGCEHHQYGWMLANVGRTAEALEELHQANNMLALYVYTPLTLADVLVAAGRVDEAKPIYDAAIALAPNPEFMEDLTATKALRTRDAEALRRPDLPIPNPVRAALLQGYRTLAGQDPAARTAAAQALLALPQDQQTAAVGMLLADLGKPHEALRIVARLAAVTGNGPSLFWYPSMRKSLDDPAFPQIARSLGLIAYWTKSRTRPDVCSGQAPPAFCQLL